MIAWILAAALQTASLDIGDQTLVVEIADTPKAREIGLMDRKSLPDGQGMLFVFDEPAIQVFWMKNTPIPLSVGFFDADRTLINTADMNPPRSKAEPLVLYRSASPAQYALEVPKGWFKKNHIEAGMKFSLHDQDR